MQRAYLFSQLDPLFPGPLSRLLLRMLLPLDFSLVKTRQILCARAIVEGDLLDRVCGLAFLGGRGREG